MGIQPNRPPGADPGGDEASGGDGEAVDGHGVYLLLLDPAAMRGPQGKVVV